MSKKQGLDSTAVEAVRAEPDKVNGERPVLFSLNQAGTDKFYQLTVNNKGKKLAMVSGNRVVFPAVIQAAIRFEVQLSSISRSEAGYLVPVLKRK